MALSQLIQADLVKSLSTAAVDSPLATQVVDFLDSSGNITGERAVKVRLLNNSGGATLQGGVYMVAYTGLPATCFQVIDCAAVTVDREVVVADGVYADGAFGWFFYSGICKALVDGDATDVAVGDTLKITAGTNADAFIIDQSGGALTADSCAVAMEANTGAEALKKVLLLGGLHDLD